MLTCECCGRNEGKLDKPFLKCGRCKAAIYCSKECQEKDWEAHKAICCAYSSSHNVDQLSLSPGSFCVAGVDEYLRLCKTGLGLPITLTYLCRDRGPHMETHFRSQIDLIPPLPPSCMIFESHFPSLPHLSQDLQKRCSTGKTQC